MKNSLKLSASICIKLINEPSEALANKEVLNNLSYIILKNLIELLFYVNLLLVYIIRHLIFQSQKQIYY